MFGKRRSRGGRDWGFCEGLGRDQDVDALKGTGVLGEAGASWTGFRVIELAFLEGASNEAEADDVVGGGFHVDDHGR